MLRERIVSLLVDAYYGKNALRSGRPKELELADQILTAIAEAAEEGELPKVPYPTLQLGNSRRKTEGEDQQEEAARVAYLEAQQDMLRDGWIKLEGLKTNANQTSSG